jgi:hypothetical protein
MFLDLWWSFVQSPSINRKYHALKMHLINWAQVALAYNPSYSGGRDQEDHTSKQDQAKSSRDPISKISNIKKGW